MCLKFCPEFLYKLRWSLCFGYGFCCCTGSANNARARSRIALTKYTDVNGGGWSRGGPPDDFKHGEDVLLGVLNAQPMDYMRACRVPFLYLFLFFFPFFFFFFFLYLCCQESQTP